MEKRFKLYTPEAAEKAQVTPATSTGKRIVKDYQNQYQGQFLERKLNEKSGPKPSMSAKRSPVTYRGPEPVDERHQKWIKDVEDSGTNQIKTPSHNEKRILSLNANVFKNSNKSPRVKEEARKSFHSLEKVAGVSPDIKMRPCAGEGCTNPVSFEHEDVTCASCTKTERGRESLQATLAGLKRSRR
jgi:hypothetical protein